MATVGILYNPNSRHGDAWYQKQIKRGAQIGGIHVIRTQGNEAILPALEKMAQQGITHLGIIGGDGTLDAILTVLRNNSLFKKEPVIALFRAGTTNMSFKDIGFKSKAFVPLRAFLKSAQNGQLRTKQHTPLMVQTLANPAPVFGFFLGAAAVPRAIHHTRRKFHTKGITNGVSEGATIGKSLWQLLRNKNIKTSPILRPVPTQITFQKEPLIETQTIVLTLTSLNKLLLGLRPQQSQSGGFSVMGITHPYKSLFKHLPTLLFGRKPTGNEAENGYITRTTTACTLHFDGEWTLDGEMFQAKAHQPLTVTQAQPFTFAIGCK